MLPEPLKHLYSPWVSVKQCEIHPAKGPQYPFSIIPSYHLETCYTIYLFVTLMLFI